MHNECYNRYYKRTATVEFQQQLQRSYRERVKENCELQAVAAEKPKRESQRELRVTSSSCRVAKRERNLYLKRQDKTGQDKTKQDKKNDARRRT